MSEYSVLSVMKLMILRTLLKPLLLEIFNEHWAKHADSEVESPVGFCAG